MQSRVPRSRNDSPVIGTTLGRVAVRDRSLSGSTATTSPGALSISPRVAGYCVQVGRRAHVPYIGELVVQEYASLRTESQTAKQNQQTILQWTLATAGVVIAAAIAAGAALKDLDDVGKLSLSLATVVLIGGLMPAVVACAFGIWIGELQRMERAGQYLAARERAWSRGRSTSALPQDPGSSHFPLWESLLADGTHDPHYQKNRLGGAASISLFGSVFIFSIGVGLVLFLGPGGTLSQLPADWTTVAVWTAGIWVGTLIVSILCVFVTPIRQLAASTKSTPAARGSNS